MHSAGTSINPYFFRCPKIQMNIYGNSFHQFSEEKDEYFQVYATILLLFHVVFSSEYCTDISKYLIPWCQILKFIFSFSQEFLICVKHFKFNNNAFQYDAYCPLVTIREVSP